MIKVKSIQPMFTALVTTMYKQGDVVSKGGIIDPTKSKTSIKEFQRVVAIGPNVRDIKVGDLVAIDPKRFEVKQFKENSLKEDVQGYNQVTSYRFDLVELNEEDHLLLQDRDIKYVVTEYEEIEEKVEPIVQPIKSSLIY